MNTQFITNPATNILARALANKHTTGAGIIYVLASGMPKFAMTIVGIWSPAHAEQVHDTIQAVTDWIKPAAVLYGLTMAGDATSSQNQIQPTNQNP